MTKFCTNCGKPLEEAAKFCVGCGAKCPQTVQTAQPIQQHAQPPPIQQTQNIRPPQQQYIQQPYYAPMPAAPVKKKSKTLLIVGIVGLSVIMLVALMLGVAWLFNQLGDPPPGHVTPPNTDPWIGLWRYEEGMNIELFNIKSDGTFKTDIYETKDDTHVVMTGKYTVSDGKFLTTDVIFDGVLQTEGFSMTFKVSGDTAIIDGYTFQRVPVKDVAAVLADPTAPYPPNGNTSQPPVTSTPPPTVSNPPQTSGANLVDERFELIALIFRLAGHEVFIVQESDYNIYDAKYADYHRALTNTFTKYKDHPAVKYASSLDISSANVFMYTFFIKEDLSGLVSDMSSLTGGFTGCWKDTTAKAFWPLAKDFYMDTGFADFYRSNIPFYQKLTAPIANDKIFSEVDINWFSTVAKKFDRGKSAKYRYIVSPSVHKECLNAWDDDTTYAMIAAILGQHPDYRWIGTYLIHEYCHTFCGAVGIDTYMTNEQFANWVDATNPGYEAYKDPITTAVEYMVRAYTILYCADNGYNEAVSFLIEQDKGFGFLYIEDVYKMVRENENRN